VPTQTLGSVTLLDATSGRTLRTLAPDTYPVGGVADERSGRVFIARVTGGEQRYARVDVRDATSGRMLRTIVLPAQNGYDPALAADARTGRVFIAYGSVVALCRGCTNDGSSVSTIDAARGRIVKTTTVRPRGIATVGFVPGALAVDEGAGRVFATSYDTTTYDGRLSILDGTSGMSLRTVPVGKYPITVAAVTRSGRLLVVDGSYNNGQVSGAGAVRLLDEASGRMLRAVPISTGLPEAIAIDGTRAFMVDADNLISVFDVRTGRVISIVDGTSGRSRPM